MMITINSKPLTDYDIADVVIEYFSQDVDRCQIILNADDFDEIPEDLGPGSLFDVHHGVTRVFQGKVINPEYDATAQTRRIILHCESAPGRALRETPRASSINIVVNGNIASLTVERADLSGTISSIVTGAASQVMTVGVIELPATQHPPEEQYNLSCLDTIRRALTYAPGAVTYIDYSVEPPAFCCRKQNSNHLTTITPDGWADHNIRRLFDQRTRQVRMRYILPAKLIRAYHSDSTMHRWDADVHESSGADNSAINDNYAELFRRTFVLPGRADYYNERLWWYPSSIWTIFNGGEPIDVGNLSDSVYADLRAIMEWGTGLLIGKLGYVKWDRDADSIDQVYGDWFTADWDQHFWITRVTGVHLNKTYYRDLMPSPALYYSAAQFAGGAKLIRRSFELDRYGPGVNERRWKLTLNLVVPNTGWSRGHYLTRRVDVQDPVTVPNTVSQLLQDDMNREIREGRITLDHPSDVAALFNLSINRIQIGDELASGITRRRFRASDATMHVEFGPPRHLSPSAHVRHKLFLSS